MRWFFFLLAISNLALAGWFYWQEESNTPRPALEEITPSQKRLQLLSELPLRSLQPIPQSLSTGKAAPALTPTTSTSAAVTSESTVQADTSHLKEQSASCVRVSHIARTTDVESLTNKLTQSNLAVLGNGEEFTERQTYWVMIPPYKTAKAAREAAALLARARVRDFLVVRSGEFRNAISLGLFSQKEGADNRLEEIHALKLGIRQPEIQPRTSSIRSHWLIARSESEDEHEALSKLITAQGWEAMPVDCPP